MKKKTFEKLAGKAPLKSDKKNRLCYFDYLQIRPIDDTPYCLGYLLTPLTSFLHYLSSQERLGPRPHNSPVSQLDIVFIIIRLRAGLSIHLMLDLSMESCTTFNLGHMFTDLHTENLLGD